MSLLSWWPSDSDTQVWAAVNTKVNLWRESYPESGFWQSSSLENGSGWRRRPLHFLPMVSINLTSRSLNSTQQTGASLHFYWEFIFLHTKRPQEKWQKRHGQILKEWVALKDSSILLSPICFLELGTTHSGALVHQGIARPANSGESFLNGPFPISTEK